ncbi:hypothetical protein OESDEN_01505 [Oesophagostomum dentatum]|uniref:Uncharacterized protein n=1 Tax=Oesophagostomum dentatum TaxID=61180 RepID=A0A0B1TQW1_OESDE|nr:hypothetical protein OESDEN_01505 [Oesophagostomum dentatum]
MAAGRERRGWSWKEWRVTPRITVIAIMDAQDSKVNQNTDETVKENGHSNKGNEDKFVLIGSLCCFLLRSYSISPLIEVPLYVTD